MLFTSCLYALESECVYIRLLVFRSCYRAAAAIPQGSSPPPLAQSECLPANALALHRMLFSLLNTPAGFPIASQLYFENQAFRFGVQQKMGVYTELFANVDHEAAG